MLPTQIVSLTLKSLTLWQNVIIAVRKVSTLSSLVEVFGFEMSLL